MQISKLKLINGLFTAGIPFYGVGFYIGARFSFSMGMLVSLIPFVLLLLVHFTDLIYRGTAVRMVNKLYYLGLLTLVSMAGGMWVAFSRGFPGYDAFNTSLQTLMILLPFHAAIIVQLTNRENDDFDFARMFLKGLSILIIVNYMGYAAGLHNLMHAFPGRINLPFMRGLYDAAHLLSLINLMLLFYIKDFKKQPRTFVGLSLFYLVNMAVMISVNSRLSFLVFLIITILFVSRIMRTARFVYPIAMFTLPLLMSFALLIYEILTLPIFSAVLSRVNKADITSFNGRSYIWEAAWDWFLNDRRDILFGGGYNGQYWIGFMDRIAVLWGVKTPKLIHMHSSSLQVLFAQGIVGVILMSLCFWYIYKWYRERYIANAMEGPLFAVAVYFVFIWQIDIFVYGLDFGIPLVFMMLSYIAIKPQFITRKNANTMLSQESIVA